MKQGSNTLLESLLRSWRIINCGDKAGCQDIRERGPAILCNGLDARSAILLIYGKIEALNGTVIEKSLDSQNDIGFEAIAAWRWHEALRLSHRSHSVLVVIAVL